MNRLKKLEQFLKASIEFGKLEEIMFGCLNGSRLTDQIYKLFEEYQRISNYFSTLQCNPIDTEDEGFFVEIQTFNESCRIADAKLTTIFKKTALDLRDRSKNIFTFVQNRSKNDICYLNFKNFLLEIV